MLLQQTVAIMLHAKMCEKIKRVKVSVFLIGMVFAYSKARTD